MLAVRDFSGAVKIHELWQNAPVCSYKMHSSRKNPERNLSGVNYENYDGPDTENLNNRKLIKASKWGANVPGTETQQKTSQSRKYLVSGKPCST